MGNGVPTFSGDGGLATAASISAPTGLQQDSDGNLVFVDLGSNRIRRVDRQSRIIQTVAFNGTAALNGVGGPALNASVHWPHSLFIDVLGNYWVAGGLSNVVLRIESSNWTVTRAAGSGSPGFGGDGGVATSALLNWVNDVAVTVSGDVLVVDRENNRIRRVSALNGRIHTIAGNGSRGFSGDGGLGTLAQLNLPNTIAIDPSDNLLIADQQNHRIRFLSTTGIITTLAGTGTAAFSGDGGLASVASLSLVRVVAIDPQQ